MDDHQTSSPPSPTMQSQQRTLVNYDKVNVEEELIIKLQLVIGENKLLKDTLHLNNVALQKQLHNLTLWHDDVIKVHHTNLHHFEETKAKKEALMDETNSLRNELITTRNKNEDLQKTVEQLKVALSIARSSASALPGYHPVHVNTALQNELDHEKAKNKALEKRNAELEAKWAAHTRSRPCERKFTNSTASRASKANHIKRSKQQDLLSIICVMNRKLESCERTKLSLEKEVDKISRQKRGLEQKLLSLQGPETALLCHSVNWSMDANLWAQTNHFFETSPPTLTLCAGETVESLTFQLKEEKQYLARAKDLLGKHQDQLTKLLTALNKPCPCKYIIPSDATETNEVGETIEALFQKIQSLQELLVSKDYEINQLKNRKSAPEDDSDKLSIMKSQLIVYRSDYIKERNTRESISSDRDRLIAELQLLREENKQLASQLETQGSASAFGETASAMRSEQKIQSPPPQVPTTTESIPDVSPGTSESLKLECPNPDCEAKFDTLEPLQYHVHQCLQLSD